MASKNKKNQKKVKADEPVKKTITQVPKAGENSEADVKVDQKPEKAAKDEKEPKSSRKSGKKKEEKPNIFRRGIDYVKSVVKELKKVTWLTGEELTKSSAVVGGCVAFFTLVTWLMDSGLGAMAAKLIGA